MQNYTRRNLIKTGSTVAALGAIGTLPSPLRAIGSGATRPRSAPPLSLIDDPKAKAVAEAALHAARETGADYADIRITHTFERPYNAHSVWDKESITLGVRTLVGGYWGFAASPIWSTDEAVRLGRAAAENSKVNMLGKPRLLELTPVTPVTDGRWITPILDDPFVTSEDEIGDFLMGLISFMGKLPDATAPKALATFIRQDKVFASTEHQYITQRTYVTYGGIGYSVMGPNNRVKSVALDTVTPAGLGFEHLRDQPLRDQIVARYLEAVSDLKLPLKPVDVGKYPIVFDTFTAAQFVNSTIGSATELDRALGEEANAGGTSYINDPRAMIGSFKIGSPLLTITGNRTEAAGAATVKWDDDGVTPDEFTIVKDGTLVDMQTNREGAGWLKDTYAARNVVQGSHGCSYSPEGVLAPLTHCGNLRMQPASNDATFESLISDMSNGLMIKRGSSDMDFQQVTGYGRGETFEIKNGKRIAEIADAGFLFRTPELWKSLTAIGGAASVRRFGLYGAKGEPIQDSIRTVTTPPIAIKELTVIDIKRKA